MRGSASPRAVRPALPERLAGSASVSAPVATRRVTPRSAKSCRTTWSFHPPLKYSPPPLPGPLPSDEALRGLAIRPRAVPASAPWVEPNGVRSLDAAAAAVRRSHFHPLSTRPKHHLETYQYYRSAVEERRRCCWAPAGRPPFISHRDSYGVLFPWGGAVPAVPPDIFHPEAARSGLARTSCPEAWESVRSAPCPSETPHRQ